MLIIILPISLAIIIMISWFLHKKLGHKRVKDKYTGSYMWSQSFFGEWWDKIKDEKWSRQAENNWGYGFLLKKIVVFSGTQYEIYRVHNNKASGIHVRLQKIGEENNPDFVTVTEKNFFKLIIVGHAKINKELQNRLNELEHFLGEYKDKNYTINLDLFKKNIYFYNRFSKNMTSYHLNATEAPKQFQEFINGLNHKIVELSKAKKVSQVLEEPNRKNNIQNINGNHVPNKINPEAIFERASKSTYNAYKDYKEIFSKENMKKCLFIYMVEGIGGYNNEMRVLNRSDHGNILSLSLTKYGLATNGSNRGCMKNLDHSRAKKIISDWVEYKSNKDNLK